MASKITNEVIDALQHCRLKAYYRLHGEEGTKSGFEDLQIERRAELRPKAIAKVRREYTNMATDLDLSGANLRKGSPFIISARLEGLSLLRGISEKTIKRYARKGVLTLTQLAHTFRPRRRGKRPDTPVKLRDYALHALAIRDRTIYVLGAPKLPSAPVCIYRFIRQHHVGDSLQIHSTQDETRHSRISLRSHDGILRAKCKTPQEQAHTSSPRVRCAS